MITDIFWFGNHDEEMRCHVQIRRTGKNLIGGNIRFRRIIGFPVYENGKWPALTNLKMLYAWSDKIYFVVIFNNLVRYILPIEQEFELIIILPY